MNVEKSKWSGWLQRGVVAMAAFGMMTAYGCANEEGPLGPETDGPKTIAVGDEDFVFSPAASSASLNNPFGDDWYELGNIDVLPNEGASSEFERYSFDIAAGDAEPGAVLTLFARDPEIVDLRFDGGGFAGDLTVSIDCAGTNVDPDSPSFDGTVPEFYELDEEAQAWVLVPGDFDAEAKTFTVTLRASYDAAEWTGMSSGGFWTFFGRAALMGSRGTGDW